MRRLQIGMVLLLWLAQIAWLSFQSVRSPDMTASVDQDGFMVTLRLVGHPLGANPQLAVADGNRDLSAYLRLREEGQQETAVRLSFAGVDKYPARVLTYTWQVDGKPLTGEHMYVHPRFPFRWQRERHAPFTIYHTGTLTSAIAAQWSSLYQDLAQFLQLDPVERTIYLLPDMESLQKALGTDGQEWRVAGLWIESLDAILVASDLPPQHQQRIMYHEFTHAFLVNAVNPTFWEEGIATWAEGKVSRRHGLWEGDQAYRDRFAALQRVMQNEGTYLVRATPSQQVPLDPYTVGLSFVLYLNQRFGEAAVRRLGAAAAERPLAEAVQTIVGVDLDSLEVDWQEFVRSGAHLRALTGQ